MELVEEIARLKRERSAVILAHYYVDPAVQEVADHVGDSFGLARLASKLDVEVIVFCGVQFMGESAKLLNPDRTVLLPEPAADCPMAHMISAALVAECRDKYGEDLAVVCYVNSTVEAKALSDVCVTSSNALSIVADLPQNNVLFIPDRHLGSYVNSRLPGKNVIVAEGCCPVHDAISAGAVRSLKVAYPNAMVLVHPECNVEVRDFADVIGSTSRLISAAARSSATDYVLATAAGVERQMAIDARDPRRRFIFPDPRPVCSDMAMITLEKVRDCLRDMSGAVEVDPQLADRARRPLERMLEMACRK